MKWSFGRVTTICFILYFSPISTAQDVVVSGDREHLILSPNLYTPYSLPFMAFDEPAIKGVWRDEWNKSMELQNKFKELRQHTANGGNLSASEIREIIDYIPGYSKTPSSNDLDRYKSILSNEDLDDKALFEMIGVDAAENKSWRWPQESNGVNGIWGAGDLTPVRWINAAPSMAFAGAVAADPAPKGAIDALNKSITRLDNIVKAQANDIQTLKKTIKILNSQLQKHIEHN